MSTEIANAHLSSEGYIILEFLQEDITLTKNEVEIGWKKALEIDPLKKHAVCLVTAKWSLLDADARTFVIKEIKSWPSVAIVVHNLGQKLIGNFAIQVTGKSKNIRIFENETDAKIWLKARMKI